MEQDYTPLESARLRQLAIEKIIQSGVSSIEQAKRLLDEYQRLEAEKDELRRQSQFYAFANAIDDLHEGEYSDKFLPVQLVSLALRLFARDIVSQLYPEKTEGEIDLTVDTLSVSGEMLEMMQRLTNA